MKNKITWQLAGYFLVVIATFAGIVGGMFFILFSRYTVEVNKQNLQERAINIANQISAFEKNGGMSQSGHGHGYGSFLNDMTMSEIWIVDQNAETIEISHSDHQITYEQLPPKAAELIAAVFDGNTAVSEDFSTFFVNPTVSAAAPIFRPDGTVSAVVLLHTDVADMSKGIRQGLLFLLMAVLCALLLTVLLAVILAMRFAAPLKKMIHTTQQLLAGNYQSRNRIIRSDEIGFLAESMDQMAGQLEKIEQERSNLDQMKQQFITSVSHELRTPITVLRGSLELLCDDIITDEIQKKEYLNQMLKDSVHMQRLINDLLELSKLQNVDFKIELEVVDVLEIIQDAVRSVRGIIREKGITIQVLRNDRPYLIQGDYVRLRQLFFIFLDNAIKFSEQNGEIKVTADDVETSGMIAITNYGGGMSQEQISHMFERFYYTKSGNNQQGSGLGLAIAREIAVRHQIELECQSKEGEYTTIILKFNSRNL